MLFWLLNRSGLPAHAPTAFDSLSKITLRAGLAALISFLLALVLGPRLIAWLGAKFREPNVSDSPRLRQLHEHKQATPTMGGLFIIAGVLGATLLLGDPSNPFLQLALLTAVGLATVGAVDDLRKLSGISRGLSPRAKLVGQFVVCGVVALLTQHLLAASPDGLRLHIPLLEQSIGLGWLFAPLATCVMVGASNAVNLTDGLDGLAGGCLVPSTSALAVMTYLCGHAELAAYLHLPHLPEAGELTIVAAAMLGGILGFLWFNCHPAQVFMGDTGSLPLGGLLGFLAVVARQELLLIIVGAVFVAEAASVIVQVGWYKWTRRRVFLCAPLHHHFQFRGWPEGRIVVRFWIVSALCAVLALASLKLQGRPSVAVQIEPAGRATARVQPVRDSH